MKLTVNRSGVEVSADDLAPLLELDPAELRPRMRNGAVTSLYEIG